MYYSWELSSFDTEILGFKTAKITHIQSDIDRRIIGKHINDLKRDLKKDKIRYATYRIAANNHPLIQELGENGFVLVDGLITLERGVNPKDKHDPTFIAKASTDDFEQLVHISMNIFTGITRYYRDPIISTETADKVYEEWIKNSLHRKVADTVLVWKKKGDIFGFITLQKKGQIPLIAVSEKARGKGIGKALIFGALDAFRKWGRDKVVIETQMTNIPALRLYHSCGFKIIGSYLTLRWHSP